LGKAGVAVSWLRGTMSFVFEEIIDCLLKTFLSQFQLFIYKQFCLKMPTKHFARLNGCFGR
jgi:hypothetical protein